MRKLDFHCHIYPAKIADKARHSTGDFYGVTCGECLGTAEDLLMRCDEAGIETCVVHSVATKPEQVDRINDFLARISAEYPNRLIPFGTVHQDTPNMEEVVDGLYARGFQGVKLHPDIQKVALNDPRLMRLYAACRGKLMVLFHAGDDRYSYSNPAEIIPVLEAFPDVIFIGAHLSGYRVWAESAEKLARPAFNEAPGGLTGIQGRMMLMRGLPGITLERWVEVCCTQPAQIMGLRRKGLAACGYDADLVIWKEDPHVLRAEQLHERADWSPFEGLRVSLSPESVLCRGEIVAHSGRLIAPCGYGRYVERRLEPAFQSVGRDRADIAERLRPRP